jgi:hypothetical protein
MIENQYYVVVTGNRMRSFQRGFTEWPNSGAANFNIFSANITAGNVLGNFVVGANTLNVNNI